MALDSRIKAEGVVEIRNYLRSRKYRNHKLTFGGKTFDSMKEYNRYLELLDLEMQGKIKDLKRQVKYVLIPAQREPDSVGKRGGKIRGKLLEREVAYYADFVYRLTDTDTLIVEDTKGMKTTEYIIKRKMMLFFHGIKIKEI